MQKIKFYVLVALALSVTACAGINPVVQTAGPLMERTVETVDTAKGTRELFHELTPAMAEQHNIQGLIEIKKIEAGKKADERAVNPCRYGTWAINPDRDCVFFPISGNLPPPIQRNWRRVPEAPRPRIICTEDGRCFDPDQQEEGQ